MKLHCNKSTINIVHNLVQYNRTKHLEVDRHFVKEKLENGLICILYVSTNRQLVNILNQGLVNPSFHTILGKLGTENICYKNLGVYLLPHCV